MSDQGEFDKAGHFVTGTTGYSMTAQINDLNAELREARAQTNFWENKYTEAEAQIAAKDAALRAIIDHPDDTISKVTPHSIREIARAALATPARETVE